MPWFVASLVVARAPVLSGALRAASVAVRVVSAVTIAATATTMTAKTSARMLRGVLRDAALQQVIAGLVLTLSGLLLCSVFWRRLEGLIKFCIEIECGLRRDPCLEAGIEGEVILAFSDRSVYLRT